MGVPSMSSLPGTSKSNTSPVEPHTPGEPLPSFTVTTEAYAHDLCREAIKEKEIDTFLQETGSYDCTEKKWSTPGAPTKTEDLVGSVFRLLSSIVRRFVKPAAPGVEREVINTQDVPACRGTNEKGYRVCPVVVVRAAGPSFETPPPRKPAADSQEPPKPSKFIGFGGIATYIVIKVESELGDEKGTLDEMKSYARCVPVSAQTAAQLTEIMQPNPVLPAQPILCPLIGRHREALSPCPFRPLWVPDLPTHRHP